MSQLRAPAARPERREGGRHGRPGSRPLSAMGRANTPAPPELRIRPQLLRAAVLPAIVAALSGAAAVVLVLRTTTVEPTSQTWTALVGTALLAFAAIGTAALGAERTAKSVLDRCNALRRSTARGQADLDAVVEQLRRGDQVSAHRTPPSPADPDADEFDLLAQEVGRSQYAAIGAVVQASRLSSSAGNEQKMEVFVNLARRLQSLVHREIQLLDDLENEVEDPELLKGLFHVDHLATRIRRHAENLAVLGGAISRRQWSKPVTMTEVLRSAIAEVEQYPRIKLVPPIDGTLRGHAVADVIHLLAELVENATLFSSPHTQVLLRAQHVTAGLAIEVEDRGLGMPLGEQKKMNGLLADPEQVDVAHLLQDGRIGLFVVSALARRHGIMVRLQSNIYGGIQAVLVLPRALLGSDRTGQPDQPDQTGQPGQPDRADQADQADQADRNGHPPARPPQPARPYLSELSPRQSSMTQHQIPQPPAQPPNHPQLPDHPQPSPHPQLPSRLPTRNQLQPQNQLQPHPAPLPVRGARHGRPATPTVPPPPQTESTGDGPAPGIRSKPQLPRRRGQEHLVPQLRGAPVPPPDQEPVLHDPGLMAAFQRGIGLAESQPAGERNHAPAEPLSEPLPEQPEPQRHTTTHKE
ncbi:sensor histidine kinase [Streptomyces sp. NPDC088400]|uniref:sensor histidine kinase n=1 Tax=Streptomyces sp. NPDC088400 TaxID=3365861 RepID=UPI00382CB003